MGFRDFKVLGVYEFGKFMPLDIPNLEANGVSISKNHKMVEFVIEIDVKNLIGGIVVQ